MDGALKVNVELGAFTFLKDPLAFNPHVQVCIKKLQKDRRLMQRFVQKSNSRVKPFFK